MEFNSPIKKNEIMKCVGKWMKLESVTLSNVTQAQKGKCHMFSHMWILTSNL